MTKRLIASERLLHHLEELFGTPRASELQDGHAGERVSAVD